MVGDRHLTVKLPPRYSGWRSPVKGQRAVICRVLAFSCALPIDVVIETMRPLPVEAIVGMPRFVLGMSIIRGAPVVVVDLGLLLGGHPSIGTRAITVRAAARTIALYVDSVIGVRTLIEQSFEALPPLLDNAAADAITAIAALDHELLVVLQGAKILPSELWTSAQLDGASS